MAVALLIEKSRPGREADQCPYGVDEGHDAHSEHDGERSPSHCFTKIELPEDRSDGWRQAYEMPGRFCRTGEEPDQGGDNDPDENHSREFADCEGCARMN